MSLDPAYPIGGIEEAPDDGQQYTRGNTTWDPSLSGVIISENLTLDGLEVSTNFVLVASATRTLTLPLASTVSADYLLSLANRSDKKNTKWLIATQGGDTINGVVSFSITTGETGLIERTSSTTYQITNAVVDVPSVTVVTTAGDTDEILIFNPTSGVIETISIANLLNSSRKIAGAFVNNNTIANGAIVNNTFTDMVFGTIGTALIAGSNIEKWTLTDEVNGTFEYTGTDPFNGSISFDFTVESSGAALDFRIKWLIDVGAGFVDLPDPVEVLVAVGSTARNVTKTFPLEAVTGDKIKPVITRNSGSSDITTIYGSIYASQ